MIPVSEPNIGKEELDNITEAVQSGWISSMGKFTGEFESNFADYCGVRFGIACVNGTAALHIALTALGIGRGDEVIVPDLTFIASANAVLFTGAEPVFIDSDPDYWCINPGKIEEAITLNTRAIIPVHLYGHPCDMDAITSIAQKHHLFIIEDAAQAHGSKYKGKMTGSLGYISCFSFHAIKLITTGEGGMCLTNDEKLAIKMKTLRDHGMNANKKYSHDLIGFNYRLTNLQAAIGVAQLKKITEFLDRKKYIYDHYVSLLRDVPGLTLPAEKSWATSNHWVNALLVEDVFGIDRDSLMERLLENGIETRNMFIPMDQQPVYQGMDFVLQKHDFPVAHELSKRGLYLPSSSKLSDGDIDYICHTIKKLRK